MPGRQFSVWETNSDEVSTSDTIDDIVKIQQAMRISKGRQEAMKSFDLSQQRSLKSQQVLQDSHNTLHNEVTTLRNLLAAKNDEIYHLQQRISTLEEENAASARYESARASEREQNLIASQATLNKKYSTQITAIAACCMQVLSYVTRFEQATLHGRHVVCNSNTLSLVAQIREGVETILESTTGSSGKPAEETINKAREEYKMEVSRLIPQYRQAIVRCQAKCVGLAEELKQAKNENAELRSRLDKMLHRRHNPGARLAVAPPSMTRHKHYERSHVATIAPSRDDEVLSTTSSMEGRIANELKTLDSEIDQLRHELEQTAAVQARERVSSITDVRHSY